MISDTLLLKIHTCMRVCFGFIFTLYLEILNIYGHKIPNMSLCGQVEEEHNTETRKKDSKYWIM
jgi:hypothetical protein